MFALLCLVQALPVLRWVQIVVVKCSSFVQQFLEIEAESVETAMGLHEDMDNAYNEEFSSLIPPPLFCIC